MIECLGGDVLDYLLLALHQLTGSASVKDMIDFMRLLNQLVAKFKVLLIAECLPIVAVIERSDCGCALLATNTLVFNALNVCIDCIVSFAGVYGHHYGHDAGQDVRASDHPPERAERTDELTAGELTD